MRKLTTCSTSRVNVNTASDVDEDEDEEDVDDDDKEEEEAAFLPFFDSDAEEEDDEEEEELNPFLPLGRCLLGLSRTVLTLFARAIPASRSAKPVCMNKMLKVVTRIQITTTGSFTVELVSSVKFCRDTKSSCSRDWRQRCTKINMHTRHIK